MKYEDITVECISLFEHGITPLGAHVQRHHGG